MDKEGAPAFLAQAFDIEDLEAEEATLVVLDRAGTIAWVNSSWARFAQENGGPDVAWRFGVGHPYLDGISGPLRAFYARVLQHVSASGEPWEQRYECSSPDEYRLLRLRISPIGSDGLLLEHSPCIQRPHTQSAPTLLTEQAYRDEHGIVLQCSNCRRVHRIGDGWDWVELWVKSSPPQTSHGLCGPCAGLYVLEQGRNQRLQEEKR